MERVDIKEENKWKLEDLYINIEEYHKDAEIIGELSDKISKYNGIVLKDSNTLLAVLELNEQLDIKKDKLYIYTHTNLDQDVRSSKYQEISGDLDTLISQINEKTSFLIPELLEKDYSLIEKYIDSNKKLGRFKLMLEMIYEEKEHILNKDIEEIMSRSSNILSSSETIFSILNNADLVFNSIKDELNNKVEITNGNYNKYMTSKNRKVRKDTFNTFYSKYKELNNTYGTILNSNLQSTTFQTKTRKYKEPINLYLDVNKISTDIYYKLIKIVNDNLDKMYSYNKLRRKKLKLNKLHMYDMLVNLSENIDKEYTYDEAKEIVIKALSVFGETYIDDLKKAFNDRWIDVYETKGKRSGAYATGCYDVHPYVLLNYQGKYKDVSTLAHEMGHAMHKYYSVSNQDYYYSGNSIFVAEIASTVNEILLSLYMLENSKNNNEKKTIINELLDDVKSTLFRQTMFAEFELDIHNRCFNSETLSAEKLNNIYYELIKKYHGKDVICDDYIKYEWSRIPHFYFPFYVYQYATGYSIAFMIANKIYEGDKDMLDKYITFLKSGSNDYPTKLVEKMGIDIEKAINTTLNKFNELLDSYSNLDKE